MVCSYRLSIVTISLSLMAAICNANSRAQTPFWGKGEGVGCQRWCYSISNGRFVRKNRRPKPISRYFEKPIPKPIPTFEKTDQKTENRYRLKKTDTDPALNTSGERHRPMKQMNIGSTISYAMTESNLKVVGPIVRTMAVLFFLNLAVIHKIY